MVIMTVAELATYLKCHPSTIYRHLKLGSIPAFKLGKDWRFKQESIDRWIRDLEHGKHPRRVPLRERPVAFFPKPRR